MFWPGNRCLHVVAAAPGWLGITGTQAVETTMPCHAMPCHAEMPKTNSPARLKGPKPPAQRLAGANNPHDMCHRVAALVL
jgi:hypothetical protein